MSISVLNSLVRSVSEHNHMKVKLLRATMIAGVPTDSGSIVDVEQHTGEYLVAIDKAEAAPITANTARDFVLEVSAFVS